MHLPMAMDVGLKGHDTPTTHNKACLLRMGAPSISRSEFLDPRHRSGRSRNGGAEEKGNSHVGGHGMTRGDQGDDPLWKVTGFRKTSPDTTQALLPDGR